MGAAVWGRPRSGHTARTLAVSGALLCTAVVAVSADGGGAAGGWRQLQEEDSCVLCWLLAVAVLAGAGSALLHVYRHHRASWSQKSGSDDEGSTTPLSARAAGGKAHLNELFESESADAAAAKVDPFESEAPARNPKDVLASEIGAKGRFSAKSRGSSSTATTVEETGS